MPPRLEPLSIQDHSRTSAGLVYVYPVVSRRAGGVSVGINLNPNNACNWRCIYCQVPDLRRGGPPPIDLQRLAAELDSLLDSICNHEFLATRVPQGQRRLADIAFSGNGEPTSAGEFADAVRLVVETMERRSLLPTVKLRLITNGSLLDRPRVQEGIRRIGMAGGEVWFKADAGSTAGIARINSVPLRIDSLQRRLGMCCRLAATWVQTCLFAIDGQGPTDQEVHDLIELLCGFRGRIAGVHLYGLARPSGQPEAPRLSPLPPAWFDGVAARLRDRGLTVEVSP